ncbi:hypothetical protein QIA19_04975 (plasmid) [Borreliella finlandensis]|uniref:Uncharacterized protein n=1 Tax=Borreliella finlandensis TaxID=498741 RepID=A0A806C7E6_9SPIR|nr:hypothetical protein [Borreliella finlandensis]ACN93505.1 conserved hypothetical protein [Borreliella finlandensis]
MKINDIIKTNDFNIFPYKKLSKDFTFDEFLSIEESLFVIKMKNILAY